jgi:hypothetical protein
MQNQKTHVRIVREWCVSLGILSAITISRQEAEMKLAAYVPMLLQSYPDEAFTTASLEHCARMAVKGFPTYGELAGWLSDWWREHRPLPPLLPPPEPAQPREPPTEEEIAYVHNCVQQIIGNMRAPFGDSSGSALSPRPRYLTPAQLDRINPLPNGRKRDGAAA